MSDVLHNIPNTDIIALRNAGEEDLETLLPLVAAYHVFERVSQPEERRRTAVGQLLADPALGEIKLITSEGEVVGYIAICFGYSIEFAGRDAFIDEFFLTEEARGRGIGGKVVDLVWEELAGAGVMALHLEVDNDNHGAQRFYARHGFEARRKYHLMSRSSG